MYSENEQIILERMLNKLPNDLFKGEGSFFYDNLSSVSIELAENKRNLEDILEKAFPQTSYGEFLEKLAALHGVFRKKGEKAKGAKFIFEGIDGTLIPKGTLVQTVSGLQYCTLDDVTICERTAVVNIESVEEGELYRVPENTITVLPVQILGVSKVYNATAVEGGSEKEDDESLRNRLLQKAQSPPACGNKQDYINWAKEIEGVKNAKVIPLWNGPGAVRVVLYGKNGEPIDNSLLNKVKKYIDAESGDGEGKAPIGASVTIATSVLRAANISIVNLTSDNMDIAMKNIEENINNYFVECLPGTVIKLKDIESIITNTKYVKDYSYILLNEDIRNVFMDDESKPILGNIDYREDSNATVPSALNKIVVIQSFASLDNVILKHGIYAPKEGGIKC
ncbi:putative phage protein gp47/JayE [Clostridium tetanomorphum]|uniref:baseplate J/gp47 family protein n=1 Tax=Clostridium tetanomorphum TaxID=1553 RepID=UPI000448BD06|nr:baseplate J/gp47 family protein [Clostridium tetanomorphum]KAJ51093.1 baseplate J family protein [Clostridium tetanomorphum DSM 665]MBP1864479.1 putative phage protein gp47/JayE [Clostridium tetanomorphum]NRS82990.1 putative phage protein gp47/JayE [Clostridium tetanomorphum]SQC01028.1 baseplate J family protein [Clostridium tetanomorphum]